MIALSVIGALAAVAGQQFLARTPDMALFLAAAVAVGIVLLIFHRRRRSPGASETVIQGIGVAFVSAVAGVGGERLYDRAPVALAAAGAILLIALILAWRRHRRAS